MALREEVEKTKKQKEILQRERDMLTASWEVAERRLEETQAQLRVRRREKEQQENDFLIQSTRLREQLAHVQVEHFNALSELKLEIAASQCCRQEALVRRENQLRQNRAALHRALLERRSEVEKSISNMTRKHEDNVVEMRHDNATVLDQIIESRMKNCQEIIADHRRLLDKELASTYKHILSKIITRFQEVFTDGERDDDEDDEMGNLYMPSQALEPSDKAEDSDD
ncbi:unnamed protein product [Knipowitschia caucasica]